MRQDVTGADGPSLKTSSVDETRAPSESTDMRRLHELSTQLLQHGDLEQLLHLVLEAAIELLGADKGTVQIYDESEHALKTATQIGFDAVFLDASHRIAADHFACSPSRIQRERVIVENAVVTHADDGFARLCASHGMSAMQATPLVGRDGAFLGVLSTHFRRPHRPSPRQLSLLDLYAQQAERVIERKRTETDLARNQLFLERIAAATPDMLYVYDLLEGRNVYSNQSIQMHMGYTIEQWQSIPGNLSETLVHPDDLPALRKFLSEFDGAAEGAVLENEYRMRHANGSWRWLAARSSVFARLPDGRAKQIIGVAVDVTERKKAHEALRAAQQQLQLVTDTMSASVSRCSRDFRYLWVSKPYAEWIGRAPEDVVGRSIEEVIGSTAFAQRRPYFERVLAGETVQYEERVEFRGLGLRWISAVYSPTLDDSGRPDGWVAVVLDVDERKRAEESLKNADRRKNEFLATLAHELRNPLAAIRFGIALLRTKGPPDPEIEWGRETIERQIQHLVRLVDDLLDVSRITQGKIELRRESIALSTTVGNAVDITRPLLEEKHHELTVDLGATPVFVHGDPTRLSQLVGNLLNNAAKYTPERGKIRIAVGADDHFATLSVMDDGIGIPDGMRTRIFDMFTQAERTGDCTVGGLGIGLTLVRSIAEMHGGSVEARSDGPNRGSEFTVRLPRIPAPAVSAAVAPQVPTAKPERQEVRRRVLVVDDNLDSAEMLGRLLRKQGNEVFVASDGLAGVEMAEQVRPEIALLDIGMPNLNGYDAARRIRGETWGRSMLLIALTGWGQDEDRRRTQEAGFDHHLVKPVDFGEVQRLVVGFQG